MRIMMFGLQLVESILALKNDRELNDHMAVMDAPGPKTTTPPNLELGSSRRLCLRFPPD